MIGKTAAETRSRRRESALTFFAVDVGRLTPTAARSTVEKADETTDYTDGTDYEEAWGERSFIRQMGVSGASSGEATVSHPWNP